MRKIIYSIEGNIGSGKSTLLRSLMNSMSQITAIPEPVEKWQHVAGYNLLDKYYEDPARWGYTFQVNCVLSRMTQLSNLFESMRSDKVYVSERSVQADKFIFAKLMHKLNKMNDMEYQLYLQMFESLQNLFNKHSFTKSTNCQQFPPFINAQSYFSKDENAQGDNLKSQPPVIYRHIYLKTSAQKCFDRIKKRNRHEEQNLQFNYIKQLSQLHDEWLIEGKDKSSLILDGQRQFETDKEYLNQLIAQIKSYIVENSHIQNIQHLMKNQNTEIDDIQAQKKMNEQFYLM